MNKFAILFAGTAIGVIAAATAPAWAVKTNVDGYFYDIVPAGGEKNIEAVRALITASDAHGLTRNNGAAVNCFGCTLPSFELKGSGTYGGVEKVDVVIDFDYRYQAIRTDATNAAAKTRTVAVANKGQTWDESAPGIFAKASSEPALERLLPVYLLPQQAVIAAGNATDKLSVETKGSDRILSIPIPEYQSTMKATIDANGFIVHTEMAWNGKTYTGEYSDFNNDRMDNHIYVPDRIVQKVDGKVITDLTLEYHWGNPYMIFRTPKEVAQK
jgi:hypothetical protein